MLELRMLELWMLVILTLSVVIKIKKKTKNTAT
jgi:hypothetical protein